LPFFVFQDRHFEETMNANSVPADQDLSDLEELLAAIPGGCSASPAQAAIEAADRRKALEELQAQRQASGSSPELEEMIRQITFEYEQYMSVAEGGAVTAITALSPPHDAALGVSAANDEPPTPKGAHTMAEKITYMRTSTYQEPDAALWEPFRTSASDKTDEEIVSRLQTLLTSKVGMKPDFRDFIKNRAEEFGLHIALNDRKTIAPAFRPYRRAEKPGKTHWVDPWIVGDRTLVDLHWHQTMGVLNVSGPLSALLGGEFSFAKAAAVACTRMSMDDKVIAAGISEVDQLLGTLLRTPRVRGRWNTIEQRLKALRRTLLNLSRTDRYRLDPPAIRELECAACALFITRGQASVAAKIIVNVGGSETVPQKMRDQKKRLDRFKCAPGGWGEAPGHEKDEKGSDLGGALPPKT
jgi:hypothetical protein